MNQDKTNDVNQTQMNSEEILSQYGLSKEYILKLTIEVEQLKSQKATCLSEIAKLQEEKKSLDQEIRGNRKKIKDDYDAEMQIAKKEASEIRNEAKKDASETKAEAKSKAEEIIRSARERAAQDRDQYKSKLAELTLRDKDILERERDLKNRASVIEEREENARIGFVRQFEEERAKAETVRQTIVAEIEKYKEKIASLDVIYEKRKGDIQEDADVYREKLFAEARAMLEKRQEELDRTIKEYQDKYQECEKERIDISTEKESLNSENEKIRIRRDDIDRRIQNIDLEVERKLEERYAQTCADLDSKRATLNELSKDYANLQRELDQLKLRLSQSRVVDVDVLRAEKKDLEAKLQKEESLRAGLYNKLEDAGITDDNLAEYKKKLGDYNSLLRKYSELKENYENLSVELQKRNNENEMLKLEQKKSSHFEKEANALAEELEKKKIVTRAERIDAITKPLLELTKLDTLSPFKNIQEEEWLDYIQKQAELSGIKFSKRLLNAYHTSIKIGEWSPLVVLAGVSGTGKSELPRQYALHGGMNFISVAVKPDWDSPQSLFGYYNSIENKFEPTELLRALYQMQSDKNKVKGEQMLMVLLDEMNLAHVEMYFSDLLSKFETRRGSNKPAQYEISLGAGADSEMLSIDSNILWTGTMNEDETTKALSDKVVDRSTLITFPRPKKLIGRSKNINQEAKYVLEKSVWKEWLNAALSIETVDNAMMLDMQDTVERINEKMSELGRNLGHRVWQGIQNYIVNHPDVIASKGAEKDIHQAFSEAVAFKIMPKLRGVETSGEYEDIIDDIAKIIAEKVPELSQDFAKAKSLPSKIFMWHSAEFLDNQE